MTFEPMTFEPMAFDLMTELMTFELMTFELMTFELMTFELLFSLKQIAWTLGELLQKGYNLVGPVAPFLSLIGLLEGALLLFLLSLPLWTSPRQRRAEKGFLVHLEKGNGALSNIAVVTGFVGTYWGLMNTLPVLATIVEGSAAEGTTGRMLSGLGTAFVSSMVGLGLGGIVGSVNGYLLDVLMPEEESPEEDNLENGLRLGSLGLGGLELAGLGLGIASSINGSLAGALAPEEESPEEGSFEKDSKESPGKEAPRESRGAVSRGASQSCGNSRGTPQENSQEKFQKECREKFRKESRKKFQKKSREDADEDSRLLQAIEQALSSGAGL